MRNARDSGDSWPKDRQTGPGECGLGGHGGHPTEARHARRGGAAGCRSRSPTRRAASPRATPAPRRAPRPRPAPPRVPRPRSASAAALAGRCPIIGTDDHDELAAWRDVARRRERRPARRACRDVTVSWTFVSSRQTAPGRSGPHASARSRSVAATRFGRLVDRPSLDRRRRSWRSARVDRARSAAGTLRTPSEPRRRPDATTAASTAYAPGIGTTMPPSAAQAATSSPPGSLTRGRSGVGDDGEVGASRADARAAPPSRAGPLRA